MPAEKRVTSVMLKPTAPARKEQPAPTTTPSQTGQDQSITAAERIVGQRRSHTGRIQSTESQNFSLMIAGTGLPNPAYSSYMIKTHLKVAFRNFSRNKVYSSINIIGLSIGMAVALLIGLWVRDELSYEKIQSKLSPDSPGHADRRPQRGIFIPMDPCPSHWRQNSGPPTAAPSNMSPYPGGRRIISWLSVIKIHGEREIYGTGSS